MSIETFSSGCSTPITSGMSQSAGTIDFTVSKLKVTYDARSAQDSLNPLVKFFHDGSNFVGVRLPTVDSKTIKWSYTTVAVSPEDESLTDNETWTFEVASTGTVTLTSPRGKSYYRSIKTEVDGFHGGTMPLGFENFKLDDGVSCYQIISQSPLIPGKHKLCL